MSLTAAFSFEMPTRIEYGMGVVEDLCRETERLDAHRVLIVTDKGVRRAWMPWLYDC